MARSRADTAPSRPKPAVRDEAGLLDEFAAVVSLAAAAFMAVSFFAYQSGMSELNFAGRVGQGMADLAVQGFGFAAYCLPLFLVVAAVLLFRHAASGITVARGAAGLLLLLCSAVLLALSAPPPPGRPVTLAGGWIGGFLAALLTQPFGAVGTFVLVGALALLAFLFATRLSIGGLVGRSAHGLRGAWGRVRSRAEPPVREVVVRRQKVNLKREAPVMSDAAPLIVHADAERRQAAAAKKRAPRPLQEELPFGDDRYQIPPTRLLAAVKHDEVGVDEEALRRSSQILEAKLGDFGIAGKVVEVRPGPVITTFDIEPAPGVKVNRIVSLGDDLAMALRAQGVRILAPVPGKAVVGIEVANARREEVVLREMIEAEVFAQSPSPLALALGKDTAGHPVAGDLARMPHLMIAGATGSGKSVGINGMIMSI
ncbi:MAG: DNA translocase FtsK 4TM domain-containing protein, partial [Candidatus Binatia bacterium]